MRDTRDFFDALCDSWRLPGRRSWFLVSLYGRGDTYLIGALLKAFRQHHGHEADDIVLIAKRSHRAVAELFAADASRIVMVEDRALDNVRELIRSAGLRSRLRPDAAVIVHPFHLGDGRIDALLDIEGVSYRTLYQYLLELPLDAPLTVPELPMAWRRDAERLAADHGMIPGRSVILMPDANSYPGIADDFWNEVSRGLAAAGWHVFTNLHGSDRGPPRLAFDQSRGINPELGIFLALSEIAGWVVSTLTGAMNIIISARLQTRKTVVALGPEPGAVVRFSDLIVLKSAFPYAGQKTFDGGEYDLQEIEVRGSGDFARAAAEITEGVYAKGGPIPSASPFLTIQSHAAPGDILDRLTILAIKEERLTDPMALHLVRREQLFLRARLLASYGRFPDAVTEKIELLKAANVEGWEMNELFFQDYEDGIFGTDQWSLDLNDPAAVARAQRIIRIYRKSQNCNRRRVNLKNEINALLSYPIEEQKSY